MDATADEVRQRTARTAAEIAAEQARIREQMERLPVATRDSADQMRRALSDQLKALDQLANLTQRTAQARDVTLPVGTGSLSTPAALPPAAAPPGAAQRPAPGDTGREGWSLGDLLARASRDEESAARRSAPAAPQPPMPQQAMAPQPFKLDIDVITRALDPATTSAVWSRLNAGHRGVLSRGLFTNEGRAMFDEVSRRFPNDGELQRTVHRYLDDFEHIRRDLDGRDPSGRMTQSHLMSDTGRVYLFLAYAAGRLV